MEDIDSPQPSLTAKVILVCVCMVQSFSTTLIGLAAQSVTKVQVSLQDSLATLHLPQDAWVAFGEIAGCLLSSACLTCIGRKTSLQMLVVPLAITCCFLTNIILWSDLEGIAIINSYQPCLIALLLFLQGAGSTAVIIVPLVLLLEMVCPRASRTGSRGLAVLYISTVIPRSLASQTFLILHYWISRMVPMVCLGNLFLLVHMPESENWLFYKRHGIHRSFSSNKACAVVLSCLGLAIIPVLLGNPLYEFYRVWSWRVAGGKVSVSEGYALLRLAPLVVAAVCLAIRPRTYHRGWITLGVVTCAVTLLASGSVLLGMERGAKPPIALPLVLHAIHTATFSASAPLFLILAAILPQAHRRTSVISMVLATATMLQHASRALLPYLIHNLHPFGLFWLHAALSILSVLYLLVVVFPRVKVPRTSQELPLNLMSKDESS